MIYIHVAIGLFVLGNFFFFWCKKQKNFGLVDIAWGLSFLITSLICFFHSEKTILHYILLLLVTIWSLRLSIYLSVRNIGEKEDFRYAQMRRDWKGSVNVQAYFKIFILQPFISFVVSLPLIMAFQQKESLSLFEIYFGVVIFLFGIIFESIADYSLYKFKNNPNRSKEILTTGVWSLCRHPNYFGEMVLWWGLFIVSGQIWSSPWTIIGPITISFFLIKVSGVPLLEEHYKGNQEYLDYAKKTNCFFPGFTNK